MADPIRAELLDILQHSLGLDQHGLYNGERQGYRNYFATGPDCDHYALCRELADAGLMVERRSPSWSGSSATFIVTDRGREVVAEQSPKPPKLTRSQKRYRAFLRADTGMSFREWLDAEREVRA